MKRSMNESVKQEEKERSAHISNISDVLLPSLTVDNRHLLVCWGYCRVDRNET